MKNIYKILIAILLIIVSGCAKSEIPDVVPDTTDNLIVVPHRAELNELQDFILNDLKIAYTPTFFLIKNSKILYAVDGTIEPERFSEIVKSVNNGENITENVEGVDYISMVGRDIDLSLLTDKDYVCMEIVTTTCPHCRTQITENNPEIIKNNQDITFIEYFILNNEDEVNKFIAELN